LWSIARVDDLLLSRIALRVQSSELHAQRE
jgi:hypothetical protein